MIGGLPVGGVVEIGGLKMPLPGLVKIPPRPVGLLVGLVTGVVEMLPGLVKMPPSPVGLLVGNVVVTGVVATLPGLVKMLLRSMGFLTPTEGVVEPEAIEPQGPSEVGF